LILIEPEEFPHYSFNAIPNNSRPRFSAHGKAQTNPAGAATMA
jgi:hypothetical protein